MDLNLKGQTALITGSTSGIGHGLAEALAAEGVNIVLNGLGETVDGGARPIDLVPQPLLAQPTSPMRRRRITQPLPTAPPKPKRPF